MRIVSFNMRAGGSEDHWRQMLQRLTPDLALVQETRDPRPFASALGLQRRSLLWEPVEHGRWGSALLLGRRRHRPLPVRGFTGWVVGAELRPWARSRPVHVYSVHVPARRRSYLREAHALLDVIGQNSAGQELVLGGDFNLTVAHRTEHEPRRNSPGEQAFLGRTEDEFGLENTWRSLHPGRPLPQTLRWVRDPVTAYHCDEILVPRSWRPALREAAVHEEAIWRQLSDHNPISAGLDRPRWRRRRN